MAVMVRETIIAALHVALDQGVIDQNYLGRFSGE